MVAPGWYVVLSVILSLYTTVMCAVFLLTYWPNRYRFMGRSRLIQRLGPLFYRLLAVTGIWYSWRTLYVRLVRGLPTLFVGTVDAVSSIVGPVLLAALVTIAVVLIAQDPSWPHRPE